jgi:hypothetical protein
MLILAAASSCGESGRHRTSKSLRWSISGKLLRRCEGDVPTCMYIVKTGQLQIRSGGVIYEDVGPVASLARWA